MTPWTGIKSNLRPFKYQKNNINKGEKRTIMFQVSLEPKIPRFEPRTAFRSLDCTATAISTI
jgi:hypothetical protein